MSSDIAVLRVHSNSKPVHDGFWQVGLSNSTGINLIKITSFIPKFLPLAFSYLFKSKAQIKRGISNRPYPVTPTLSFAFNAEEWDTILKAHQAATVFMWATLQKLVLAL